MSLCVPLGKDKTISKFLWHQKCQSLQPRRVSFGWVILFSELRVAHSADWAGELQCIYSMSTGEEWHFWIFLYFFLFSLFVGLSADRIIFSFILRKSPSHNFYELITLVFKEFLNNLVWLIEVSGKAPACSGENVPFWATLGMCLAGLAGSFQPWKCPRQPSLCSAFPWHSAVFYHNNLRLDPTGGWFSPL